MMSRGRDLMYVTEYIKNILYFATVRPDKTPKCTSDTHYFCIDQDLVYENYYADFGPVNLGCVYKYCQLLSEKLKLFLNKQVIVHYTSSEPKKAANAAFLMGCYGVLYLGLSPKDAMKPLTVNGTLNYKPFQDATQGESIYTITILDCLKAIKKANNLGFFNFKDFNFEEYDRLDKITGGDLNWIVPGKFLAFIGPVDYSISLYHPPEMYIDYFLENDVRIVVRLNKRLYDGNIFKNVGIQHYDLYFTDGSCPPRHILFKFLQLSEDANCAIAVHCKAGLGRTGSLIGSYLIKHYRMSAREAIGWMRICRPGSVIGHQQGWLEQLEQWLIKQGNLFRKKHYNDMEHMPIHTYGVYSITEKNIKRQPLFLGKAQNSPPPIHRAIRSETQQPRPQASRFREAINEAPKEHKGCVRTPKEIKQYSNSDQKGRSRSTTRRGSGESRSPTLLSVHCSPKSSTPSQYCIVKANADRLIVKDTSSRNVKYSRPIPLSPSPTRKLSVENRNQAKGRDVKRGSRLSQAITVTAHSPQRNYQVTAPKSPSSPRHSPSSFSTVASQGSYRQCTRRRLGRSPSPSPGPPPSFAPAQMLAGTRALNTPAASAAKCEVKVPRAAPRMSPQKNMSRLLEDFYNATGTKLRSKPAPNLENSSIAAYSFDAGSTGTEGSLGGASLGAGSIGMESLGLGSLCVGSLGVGSLGARRRAPAPAVQRAPRVRSDERTLATQGDMLNSIKIINRSNSKERSKFKLLRKC